MLIVRTFCSNLEDSNTKLNKPECEKLYVLTYFNGETRNVTQCFSTYAKWDFLDRTKRIISTVKHQTHLQVAVSRWAAVGLLGLAFGFAYRVPATNLVLLPGSSRKRHTGWKSCACWEVLWGGILSDREQTSDVMIKEKKIIQCCLEIITTSRRKSS